MGFVSAKTGEKITLKTGYVSPQVDYQTRKNQRETKTAGSSSTSSSAGSTAPVSLSSGTLDDRRAQELASFTRQRQQAQVDLDTDAVNRIDRAMKNIQAAQGTQAAGSTATEPSLLAKTRTVQRTVGGSRGGHIATAPVEVPTLYGRVSDAAAGMVKSYGGGMVNALGTTQEAAGAARRNYLPLDIEQKQRELARYLENIRYAADSSERQYWEYEAARAREAIAGYEEGIRESWTQGKSTQALADRLSAAGAKDITRAKDGLGTAGQLAVDVGVAGGQMLADAGLGVLTGGSALVPMAVRSFGGGAQEARHAGADLDQQLIYGLGSAALSVGTEQISNLAAPFKKLYGTGAAETIAGTLLKRFGENGAVQVMQQLSRTAVGRIALSAIGEGCEEMAEAFFQPFLKQATYDPSARFDAGEAWHDALVGGILGGIGGSVEVIGNAGAGHQTEKQNYQALLDETDVNALPSGVEHDIIGTEKEGKAYGKEARGARTESREHFLGRSRQALRDVFERDGTAFGYRIIAAREAAREAKSLQEELTALGIPSVLMDGEIEWNRDDITDVHQVSEAVTIAKKIVAINGAFSMEPRNAAGHEAYHFWGGTKARRQFREVLEDQLLYTSDAFQYYQSVITEDYFKGDVDLGDSKKREKFFEELFAYISGDIHEGVNDDALRPMFRDYDAVKAAWQTLISSSKTAPDAAKAGNHSAIQGQEIRRLYRLTDATVPEARSDALFDVLPGGGKRVELLDTDNLDIAEVYLRELEANLPKNPTQPKPDIATEMYLWLLYKANLRERPDAAGDTGNTWGGPEDFR